MAKHVYVVTTEEGIQEVTSLKEVANLIGVGRVTKADIEAGKYPMVTFHNAIDDKELYTEEDVKEALESVGLTKEASEHETAATTEDNTLTDTHEEDTEDGFEVPDDADDILEYPEVGEFKDVKAMKKYIKGLSDEQLREWCELEGATWVECDHQSINRMRMAMAIKAVHFPETKPSGKKKSKSKYSKYTTEELVQMALDNDVEVRDDKGDPRILRMYTIMALREAGILD